MKFLDNTLYDLDTTGTDFLSDAALWGYNNNEATPVYTDCGGIEILGGHNVLKSGGYFENAYSGLPPHNVVYFSFRVYIVDDWDPTDWVRIRFDGLELSFHGVGEASSSNICGDPNIPDNGAFIV